MLPAPPYTFKKMDEVSAREIAAWQYPAPYDIYNFPADEIELHIKELLLPELHYYAVRDNAGILIAFRNYGLDARVPGGDYTEEALDLGGGLRPDLTGQGLGADMMEAAFEFARQTFLPTKFRATVAAFNQRALKVCQKVGYQPVQTFKKLSSEQTFIILMRDA